MNKWGICDTLRGLTGPSGSKHHYEEQQKHKKAAGATDRMYFVVLLLIQADLLSLKLKVKKQNIYSCNFIVF